MLSKTAGEVRLCYNTAMKFLLAILVIIFGIAAVVTVLQRGSTYTEEFTGTQFGNQNINNNQPKTMFATISTSKGNITLELSNATPVTTANFRKLAQEGFYNGVKFHRVIKGFMIQSGDPLTRDDTKQDLWGTGGPGYQFADEIGRNNRNEAGTISMANAGPNTNGSQFFINTADNNFLDDKHTVFGKVTAGGEVVWAIESVQTDSRDRPISPVVIYTIDISSR